MSECERCKGASRCDVVGLFQIAGFHHVSMCTPCSREWDRKVLEGAWQRLMLAQRRLERCMEPGCTWKIDEYVEDVASARQLMVSWFTLFLLSDPDDEEDVKAAVDAAERVEAES